MRVFAFSVKTGSTKTDLLNFQNPGPFFVFLESNTDILTGEWSDDRAVPISTFFIAYCRPLDTNIKKRPRVLEI